MKLVCDRRELAEAVGLAASVVPSRSPKKILTDILIRAERDRGVEVAATDLEVGVRVRVGAADTEREGAALVPADTLAAIVREAPGDRVELVAENQVTVVMAAGSEYRLAGDDPREFPEIPAWDERDAIHFGRTQLEAMIRKTAFAAATESARYALNGVLFELRGDRLRLVATDGKRLALVERPVEPGRAATFARVVPIKAVHLLAKIGGEEDATIEMRFTETSVLARSARATVSAQLVQEHFPPYEEVIPRQAERKVEFQTAALAAALRRAALLTTKESQAVRLRFDYNRLTLSSRSPELGESKVELAIAYEHDPLEIGFNASYLLDALKAIDREQLVFELSGETQPGVIREGEGLTYVVMPMSFT